MDQRAAQTQERLENELGGYKTNLIKESIRMGYHELAEHYYRRGDINVRMLLLEFYKKKPVDVYQLGPLEATGLMMIPANT